MSESHSRQGKHVPPELDLNLRIKIKAAVIGGGAFGTAMAAALARVGHSVKILVIEPEIRDSINIEHKNCLFMTQYTLDPKITATLDPKDAFEGVKLIIHAVPVQFTYDYVNKIAHHVPRNVPIVSISKGIDSNTLEMMNEVLPRALGRNDQPLAYLSGPSFAEGIIENDPTSVVVASNDKNVAREVQLLMSSSRFRIYTSSDVVGVLIGGALKNVIAIGAGVAEGLKFGHNTLAALVTRGNAELQRLAEAMGADKMTLAGLSGHGDLVLTCYGSLSRNRTVGQLLASGKTIQEIMKTQKSVAEGVYTTPAAVKLIKKIGLDPQEFPIINAVNLMLEGKLDPKEAVHSLMERPLKDEYDSKRHKL